jgi:hypothetical protein
MEAPNARYAERHDLQITRRNFEHLPETLKQDLTCRLVDELGPIVEGHTIEGLLMGDA